MPKNHKELIRSKIFYSGTSIGDSFWHRYKDEDLYERGYGELWLTRNALYFRRYLTMTPLEIPIKTIFKISTGHAHAGKISIVPVMKIHWSRGDKVLVFGFSIPHKLEELLRWQRKLQKVAKVRF
jgi:hypothetical protein